MAVALAATPVTAQVARPGATGRVEANHRLGTEPQPARGKDVPGLAVDPADARHVVAVDIDFLNGRCEHHVSFDGGATWASGLLSAPAGFPAADALFPNPLCLPGSAMDGSVAFGSGQNVYTTFAARRSTAEGLSVLVARSTDGGRSFAPAVLALPGGATGTPRYSNPELAVQARAGGDRVTVGTVRGAPAPATVVATTSNDSGATWGPAADASAPTPGAFFEPSAPVVAPDGRIHIAWRNPGTTSTIGVGTSTDGGATWTRVEAAQVSDFPVAGTDASDPRIAVDPRNGAVYVVYMEGVGPGGSRQDHFISANADVRLIRSGDGGTTWSAPIRVNDDLAGNLIAQRQPKVAVAPNGRVDVVWQDRRHGYRSPTNAHLGNGEFRAGDTYYAYSLDNGATFSANRRITDRTINNDVGLDYRSGTYQFFSPSLVPLGDDKVLFAWMDSREGNVDNDTQDIYLATVDLRAGAAAVPVRRIEPADPASFGVALSHLAHPGGSEAVLNVGFTTRPATRVVVVNASDPSAALMGGVLARAHVGSVLAAPGGVLTAAQTAEVERLAPIGAYVLGDEASLPRTVLTDLLDAGVPPDQVIRVSPGTPAAQAADVAGLLDRRTNSEKAGGVPAFDAVMVVNPASAEAATAVGLAASARLPLLFTEGPSNLPAATTAALRSLNVATSLVVGSSAVVADSVLSGLPGPRRLGGADVTAVSEAVVAESVARRLPTNQVYVADANRPLDAGLLAAAVARAGGLQLVLPGADPVAAEASLTRLGLRSGVDAITVAQSVGATGAGGYRLVAADGGVFAFGSRFLGSLGATRLNRPVVAGAQSPSGNGYWLVGSDGGVFSFGDARFFGSTGALRLAQPVVAMASTPSGKGYWLVASDGGVFAFGDAAFLGSTGATRLNQPIVAAASTPSGRGYWLIARDGGVFAFGDARFLGSTGATRLNQPIVAAASTPSGRGYWLVASDGGVFAFGDAAFKGSTGAIRLARPIVGVSPSPSGNGYVLVASDGGVFAFGDATFKGSTGAIRLASPIVAVA
ncbi:MAG: hypothetical protein ACRDZW_08205 [Acidimicrobiales bacterium]